MGIMPGNSPEGNTYIRIEVREFILLVISWAGIVH
jgi:hypothetical protein